MRPSASSSAIAVRTASPRSSSGPISVNRAAGNAGARSWAARTNSTGRLRAATRARNSTSGCSAAAPARCSTARSTVGGTPLGRTTGSTSCGNSSCRSVFSRGTRAIDPAALRITGRVMARSSGFARSRSEASIMPWVCTTRGTRRAAAARAVGKATRSRARCRCTTSYSGARRATKAVSRGATSPAKPVPGTACRAGKRVTVTPSYSCGNGPSKPCAPATRSTWWPRARSARTWLTATRSGPPKDPSGVTSVTTCMIFTARRPSPRPASRPARLPRPAAWGAGASRAGPRPCARWARP